MYPKGHMPEPSHWLLRPVGVFMGFRQGRALLRCLGSRAPQAGLPDGTGLLGALRVWGVPFLLGVCLGPLWALCFFLGGGETKKKEIKLQNCANITRHTPREGPPIPPEAMTAPSGYAAPRGEGAYEDDVHA